MNKTELAKHIKTMRKKVRLNQKELATLLDCSTAALCSYEQEKVLPRDLDLFLCKLESVTEEVSRFGKPDKRQRNKFSKKLTMGEELDWEWYKEDILEAEEMYMRGIPVEMIASSFARTNLETSIMLAIRAEERHIEPRTSGVFGRLEG